MSGVKEDTSFSEEQLERIRKFAQSDGTRSSILEGKASEEKRIKCLSCGGKVAVPKSSAKAYCYRCAVDQEKGQNIHADTKQVECIRCETWFESPRESSASLCDPCRGERLPGELRNAN